MMPEMSRIAKQLWTEPKTKKRTDDETDIKNGNIEWYLRVDPKQNFDKGGLRNYLGLGTSAGTEGLGTWAGA